MFGHDIIVEDAKELCQECTEIAGLDDAEFTAVLECMSGSLQAEGIGPGWSW